ncbi:peptidase [Herbaspirillum sp. DW155]|uniref:hypothetical protein n=1 Tax=Herbaspirillum sp. DW155 TaxID=3095609 RepID=UPI00308E4318|nr:peptidase [Herbaspirillum sp. DW155]
MILSKLRCKTIFRLLIVLLATWVQCRAEAGAPAQPEEAKKHWAMVAYRDLAFMRESIDAAHPGVLEEDDEEFHTWREAGYVQAQALASRATSEREAIAAVQFYAVGFKDGHLWVAQNSTRRRRSAWAGWIMEEHDGQYFVSQRAAHWPVALPPVGVRVLECDGRAVSDLIREDIMPFVDRRVALLEVRRKLAAHLTVEMPIDPRWTDRPVQSCLVELPDGHHERFALHWREEKEGLRRVFARARHPLGLHDMGDGTYWVNVSDFQLDQAGLGQLEQLLAQLRKLDKAKMVILDTRGNQGGNSAFGDRILQALLKQAMPPGPEHASAWWRVSQIAIDTLQSHVDRYRLLEGASGPEVQWLTRILDKMRAAQASGAKWVDNGDVPELAETGLPFQGRLGLVTDAYCASACLDFADAVLSIPGALHVGEPTSADTNYLDLAQLRLPGGLMMAMPLKVHRGRLRRSNEPLIPHFVYGGDMNDTARLQQWVLQTMLR